MKKLLLIMLVLLVPLFTFLEIWRVYEYQNLQDVVDELGTEQVLRLEENKKVLKDIAVYSSPKRIDDMAKNKFKLEKRDSEKTWKIEINRSDGF